MTAHCEVCGAAVADGHSICGRPGCIEVSARWRRSRIARERRSVARIAAMNRDDGMSEAEIERSQRRLEMLFGFKEGEA